MTFSVRNVGNAALQAAAAGFTFRTSGPQSTLFPFRLEGTAPCVFSIEGGAPRPGESVANALALSFHPRPIDPEQSRSCTVGLRVSPEASGPFVQQFGFVAISGEIEQNVTVSVLFPLGDPPPLVPTLSLHWLSLLGGLFAGIAALALRR